MILSEDRPDLSGIVSQFGQGAPGETKDYAPLLERIARGGVWRFRLTANPTVGKPPACAHDRVREGERGGAPMERGEGDGPHHARVPEEVAAGPGGKSTAF